MGKNYFDDSSKTIDNVINPGHNGHNFVNSEHSNRIQDAGQITSRDIFLAVKTGEDEDGDILEKIGSLSGMNISIGNQVIPLPEMGSTNYAMLMGRTQPFSLSCQSFYIANQSMLGMLNHERRRKFSEAMEKVKANADIPDTLTDLCLDMANKAFAKPVEFKLLIYTYNPDYYDGSTESQYKDLQVLSLNSCRIQNYGLSFGQGIVIYENTQMTGTGITEEFYESY
jgi:hypothetical protein